MIDLSVRATEPEWMDAPDIAVADFGRCLADLEIVNRLTLGHRPVLRFVARVTKDLDAFSLLDVGYGHGDLLRAIARWAAKRGKRATLSGIDLSPSSEIAARAATPPDLAIDYRTADVFDFVPANKPDFIVTSLMTHHLTDADVVKFLRWIDSYAGRGWFDHDLHRSRIAYWGFRAMAAVSRWHPMVRHDGAVSIAKSFRRADWERFLAAAGVRAEIRWMLPFKLCVSSLK